jgi:hypothetical protein
MRCLAAMCVHSFLLTSGSLAPWRYKLRPHASSHFCPWLQAAAALFDDNRASGVAGRPFFVTNHEPRRFWGMLGDVCEGLGYSRPRIHLPFLLIMAIAMLFEYVIRPLLKPFKELNTDFTVNRCAGILCLLLVKYFIIIIMFTLPAQASISCEVVAYVPATLARTGDTRPTICQSHHSSACMLGAAWLIAGC